MNLGETFNIDDLPVSGEYEVLPAGWYSAVISGAELKPTKDGSGQYIAVKYDIIGPTHQGRTISGNLNIRNKTAKAEEIGRQQLGEIMRSIGLSSVRDTDQLIGGNLQIKLNISPATDQYPAKNEVKAFKAVEGRQSIAPQVKSESDSQAPAKASPPWAKK